MPETIFLADGKFDSFLQMDKDYCLTIDNKTKMVNLSLRMKLTEVLKDRKADCLALGLHKQINKRNAQREGIKQISPWSPNRKQPNR